MVDMANHTVKYNLRKVRLTSTGYEVGTGYYYGVGQPVWHWSTDEQSGDLRAYDRDAAKAKIKAFDKYAIFAR